MNVEAIILTGQVAATTTAALIALGIPLAYWLAFSRFRGRFLIEAVVALPLVLPPTVLGFYLLVGLGPRGPIGSAYERIFGQPIVFTFQGLVIASVVYSLPFAVNPLITAFASIDRLQIEASWTLGASPRATFFRVVLPQCRYAVLSAAVLTFAHTVGEFGVVLMVGGNIAGVTRTVSIDIYDRVQLLDYGAAGTTSALLLAFSFLTLSAVYALNRRTLLPDGR